MAAVKWMEMPGGKRHASSHAGKAEFRLRKARGGLRKSAFILFHANE
jgi:hypothetical protein